MIAEKDRIILGIDPGTNVMGFGVIRIVGAKIEMMDMGILDLRKEGDTYLKLKKIYDFVILLIEKFLPDEFAIEAQFFGKNVQSMLKLGRSQGVAIAAALQRDLPIAEYAPLKIKMSITGNGAASKEQVAKMLVQYLKISEEKLLPQLDATDALAVALCHYFQSKSLTSGKKFSSWKDFAAKNENRVRGSRK
ncbi:MAG: crossover junction endodeoxyribonuclease RuvC [Paludibacteraceae bacterium]|nr:crossover junction endodeoxyribonuclease RuvC [Bacteroidales bacterium]MBQ9101258.1 crossover junction endodeoxyribonuclease RuvC [Paludibacteraceae bacterium]MBR6658705.1 crossover junction endodeoxyribonuclease RuvC [Paludibacteraceae bacterium]